MKLSRRVANGVLLVALLVMQAQVWASATLGCRHERGIGRVVAVACPFHHPSDQRADPGHPVRLLDCQKCVLHLAIGVPALGAGASALLLPLGHSASSPRPDPHFYRFTPDSIHRPPIA